MLYFIVNETSRTGKGKSVFGQVKEYLKENQISYEVYKTEYQGHATLLAKEICEKDDEDICLLVVGGDGTVNEVLNGMTHFEKVRFGLIPSGSGNDFRRGLKLPKDPIESIRKILELKENEIEGFTKIDLGKVTWGEEKKERIFGISSGFGLDAIVCKKSVSSGLKKVLNKLHLGKLTYVLLTVATLFSMETTNATFSFETNDFKKTITVKKLIFSAVMNLFAEGGGVPMTPKGNPFDGLCSICFVHGIPKWLTFFCLPILVMGKQEILHGFDMTNALKITVTLEEPVVLHADGEYLGDVTSASFTCLPQKLRVLM